MQRVSLLTAVRLYFGESLAAFLLGLAPLGAVAVPLLAAASGFLTMFAVACFVQVYGRAGCLLALAAFGPRVLPGGDMEEDHRLYLEDVAGYELGTGSTTQQRHQAWIDSLSCKVIRLDGAAPIESNAEAICQAWWKVMELVKETGK